MKAKAANEHARKHTRMIVGPWGHGATRKFGDVDFGEHAFIAQFEEELRFFDYHLKGIQNGLDKEPPVKIYYMGVNQWKQHSDWPIPGTQYKEMYLDAKTSANGLFNAGTLSWTKPAAKSTSSYRYDPASPVPTIGGNNCCGTPTLAGPKDQRPLEQRQDVLVYQTDFLKEALAIAGPVSFKLHAATDGPDTDWVVKLIDVYPNGFSMPVAEGILRARYRKGFDQPSLLTPNEVYEFKIPMAGTANVFQKGHRLRILITSSDFPQFDRNPNTGETFAQSDKIRVATQTVVHSPVQPSAIVLPVVPLP
jgi:putative CocE/NonD family hydrolase